MSGKGEVRIRTYWETGILRQVLHCESFIKIKDHDTTVQDDGNSRVKILRQEIQRTLGQKLSADAFH